MKPAAIPIGKAIRINRLIILPICHRCPARSDFFECSPEAIENKSVGLIRCHVSGDPGYFRRRFSEQSDWSCRFAVLIISN
jgi:hypothetical protein